MMTISLKECRRLASGCAFCFAVNDFFDPFGMGSDTSAHRQSEPDLFGDLLGSEGADTTFASSSSNPPPASNSSLFDLSKSSRNTCVLQPVLQTVCY